MRTKGLTLIEVLVAMGIATVAGMLLVVIIVNSAGLFTRQSSKVSGGLSINDALLQIRGSIKQASAVVGQYISGPITYTTGVSQLVLKVSSIDSSGNIIANTYDFFVFFVDQGSLHFKTFPDSSSFRKAADQVLSIGVDSLNFQYFNSANPPVEIAPVSATKVRITLILKQNIATSEADLRND